MRKMSLLLAAAFCASPVLMAASHAGVVWSENFDGQTDGAAPSTDFPGGAAGEDWSVVNGADSTITVSTAQGNPAPSAHIDDTGGGLSHAAVSFTQFAPFDMTQPGQHTLKVSFDMRVDSLGSVGDGSASTPRFYIQDGSIVANEGHGLVVGFGRNKVNDGDANSDLFFYVGGQVDAASGQPPSSALPDNGTAIGLNPGTGWAPGFDFGDVSSTANDNNTNDEFYHFVLVFTNGSKTVTGTVTQISTGDSTTFSHDFLIPLSFSSSSANADHMQLYSGQGGQSQAYFDNIKFETVPEPGSLSLLTLGGLALLKRRRK